MQIAVLWFYQGWASLEEDIKPISVTTGQLLSTWCKGLAEDCHREMCSHPLYEFECRKPMLNKISLEPEHFLRLCRGILTFNGTVYFHLFQKSWRCLGVLGFFFFFCFSPHWKLSFKWQFCNALQTRSLNLKESPFATLSLRRSSTLNDWVSALVLHTEAAAACWGGGVKSGPNHGPLMHIPFIAETWWCKLFVTPVWCTPGGVWWMGARLTLTSILVSNYSGVSSV